MPASLTIASAIFIISCAGCAGSSEPIPAQRASEEQATPPTSEKRAVALTSDKLSAYERGMKKEIEAVRAAHQRADAAKTPQERGAAGQAAFEHATIPQGAAAAGLSIEEYGALRETVNGIFQTLDFQEKIDGPLSMDLARRCGYESTPGTRCVRRSVVRLGRSAARSDGSARAGVDPGT